MKVSQQDLLKIVEQASTITERLSDGFIREAAQANYKLSNSRTEKWCQVVAQGNQEKFAKRLAWDNLNVNTVHQVLGNVRLADAQKLPIWAETLREVLQTDLQTGDVDTYRCLNPEEPIPFEDVFLPFVQVARQKLIAQTGVSYQLLSEKAHSSLQRSLLNRLSTICAQSLQLEFSAFRVLKQSGLSRLLGQLQGSRAKEQYQDFVKSLTTGGMLSFFQKYNALARLVATATDFWVEATAEFLQRLASDLPTIQQTFLEDTGQVVAIEPFLSDPHNRGRSVLALTFASGLKLIYKPKNLALEAAYLQLLAWFNQQSVLLPFQLLKLINRTTHGWVEYVQHLPCEDEAAAKRHYRRAGMLLCLLYSLGATDCHQENLIASGEHLVLIDMETIMHPHASDIAYRSEEVGAQSPASQEFFGDSVLRVGLIPRWEYKEGQVAYDISGLGGVGGQEIPVQMPKWQHINTDNMALEYEIGTMPSSANAPTLNGITLSANNYVDEIVDGFQQMYLFLMERREALLMSDSPLGALAHQQVRFVFRATEVYARILLKTLHPEFLRNGADRSIELDVLSRALLVADTKPSVWSLLAMELQALEQLDVPYFTADSNSDALTVSPELKIAGCFKEPSYDRAIFNLQQLSDANLAQQIAIIRGSLYSRATCEHGSAVSTERVAPSVNLSATAQLTQAQIIQEAVAIAQELQQRADYAVDGSVNWIGMAYIPRVQRLQLQPLDYSLYDGVCGIALFLAALEKITGGAGFRDLALRALQPLRKNLHNTDSKFKTKITKQIGIGGATGIGSIIYTLVRSSQFLNEPELLDLARLAASLISQESIASDRYFDTMSGAAGTILGLLALYQATLDSAVLEQAIACGYHLLHNRTASNSGPRAWANADGKLMTGLAHGAAGIAYSLLRLYQPTQESAFLEAATEAIVYERSVYCPIAGNWPDVRSFSLSLGKPSFQIAWCHGASGVGLARLGGLKILDNSEIRQDIAVALNTTQEFGLENLDRLCCGNFGRMELLLLAGSKLSRPQLWETAQKQAARVLARAKHAGAFYLLPELPKDVYNPGFFQGTAGIGYELLRLAYPESLPSVLLWE
ncbi:type 2 lantipeptide synthetase LanM [Tolypothrix campylonemoides VB511288]|nr:type 2 lantipeptide synthetase LanM [Tolypothrix campylonemoides VB511288]